LLTTKTSKQASKQGFAYLSASLSLPRGTPERQPADDRRQSQTTVAGAGRPSLELDNRRQSYTTVIRARQPSPELDNRR